MSEFDKDKYEVRFGFYFGPVMSEAMIKCIKFDIEMKQHYEEVDRKHEELKMFMQLKPKLLGFL